MKNKEIKEKNAEELQHLHDELTKELVALRIQRSVGQQVKAHRFKEVRRNIARVKMYLHLIAH